MSIANVMEAVKVQHLTYMHRCNLQTLILSRTQYMNRLNIDRYTEMKSSKPVLNNRRDHYKRHKAISTNVTLLPSLCVDRTWGVVGWSGSILVTKSNHFRFQQNFNTGNTVGNTCGNKSFVLLAVGWPKSTD